METRSVSRCVAIAAHGKRCQQSPFNGSPYCWHHTQSRKIWAPSRPLSSTASASSTPRPAGPAAGRRDDERRTGGDRRAGWSLDEGIGRELVEALGRERAQELVQFLLAPEDGAYLLVRENGGLLSERSVTDRPPRRRSA